MNRKEFVEKFRQLQGWNEFDPALYDVEGGLEGFVSLNDRENNIYASHSGLLNARKTPEGIKIKVYDPNRRFKGRLNSSFEFKVKNLIGYYSIDRETTAVGPPWQYQCGFYIKSENDCELRIGFLMDEIDYLMSGMEHS